LFFFFDEERAETLLTVKNVYDEYRPEKFILVRNAMTSPERRTFKCDLEVFKQLSTVASCSVQLNTPKTDLNICLLFQKIHELCTPPVLESKSTTTTTRGVNTTTVNTTTTTTTTTTTATPSVTLGVEMLSVSSVSRKHVSDVLDIEDQVKMDRKKIIELMFEVEKLKAHHLLLQSKYDSQKKVIGALSTQ